MKASRKQWSIFAVLLVVIAACSFFLMRVTQRANAPTPARTTPAKTTVETPEHEYKELTVELGKKPDHTPVLMRMAQLERDKGKLDDAATHLRTVLEHEPGNLGARLELGRVLYEKGDVGGAITQTEKILEASPKDADALYNMGAIYANLGDRQRARSYWTQAEAAGSSNDSARKAREGLAKLGGG